MKVPRFAILVTLFLLAGRSLFAQEGTQVTLVASETWEQAAEAIRTIGGKEPPRDE